MCLCVVFLLPFVLFLLLWFILFFILFYFVYCLLFFFFFTFYGDIKLFVFREGIIRSKVQLYLATWYTPPFCFANLYRILPSVFIFRFFIRLSNIYIITKFPFLYQNNKNVPFEFYIYTIVLIEIVSIMFCGIDLYEGNTESYW